MPARTSGQPDNGSDPKRAAWATNLENNLLNLFANHGATVNPLAGNKSEHAVPVSQVAATSNAAQPGTSVVVTLSRDSRAHATTTRPPLIPQTLPANCYSHTETDLNTHCAFNQAFQSNSQQSNTQIARGEHSSLPKGRYCVQEPVSSEKSQELAKIPLGEEFDELPERARQDICHIAEMFAYKPSVKLAEGGMFDVTFSIAGSLPSQDSLPPQAIQRVYWEPTGSNVALVTMEVPLSAPLYWKKSETSTTKWPLLDEILHCPDPDKFPMQHRMWRLFHDNRRQALVREYLGVHEDNMLRDEYQQTFLGDCAEQVLYMFDIGRPPRIWTVGGEGSGEAGFAEGSQSSFGGCMFTYAEADVLLFNEAEHVIWAAHNHATKNILIFDEAFNRRRPGKSTAKWLAEFELQGKEFPETDVDVQLLPGPKKMRGEDEEGDVLLRAANNLSIQDALAEYRTFRSDEPISLKNAPTNFLNITDEAIGHWPEGMVKHYTLLRELIQNLEAVVFTGLKDTHGKAAVGKPKLVVRTSSDIQKCQQFRILAQRGAASDWHIDQNGVYTFVHLEDNLEEGSEAVDDVLKYWPWYPLDHFATEDQQKARLAFAQREATWRPTPDEGIPVLPIVKGYMLLQRPGNIHAPITLTECLFLGGMAWKHSTLKEHLQITEFLAHHEECTNEDLPSQIQTILLTLRRQIETSPERFGYPAGLQGLEDFDRVLEFLYGKVSACECAGKCATADCACKARNVMCGNRCHQMPSKKKGSCQNHDPAYEVIMGRKNGRS